MSVRYFFIYVSGGQNEAHPMLFNLIYNGEKVVLYCIMKTYRTPSQDDAMILHSIYDIIEIVMLKVLDGKQETIIDIIKSALTIYSTTIVRDG